MEALRLSIELNRPSHTLSLLQKIYEEESQNEVCQSYTEIEFQLFNCFFNEFFRIPIWFARVCHRCHSHISLLFFHIHVTGIHLPKIVLLSKRFIHIVSLTLTHTHVCTSSPSFSSLFLFLKKQLLNYPLFLHFSIVTSRHLLFVHSKAGLSDRYRVDENLFNHFRMGDYNYQNCCDSCSK